jgi:Sulfatase
LKRLPVSETHPFYDTSLAATSAISERDAEQQEKKEVEESSMMILLRFSARIAKRVKFFGASILCWLLLPLYVSAEVPTGPNIVILYADDMGFGDLGIQNSNSKIPTPYLDRLAREGMRFTDAHSSSGICSPSRYALLTGRFHWRKFHDIVKSFDPPVFDATEFTLPEMLKSRGYRTACMASGTWAGTGKRSRGRM